MASFVRVRRVLRDSSDVRRRETVHYNRTHCMIRLPALVLLSQHSHYEVRFLHDHTWLVHPVRRRHFVKSLDPTGS